MSRLFGGRTITLGRPSQQNMQDGTGTNARGLNQKESAKFEKEERKKDIEAIVQGLALGRVIWRDHDMCGDLWFFLKNNDPVLSIFFCHKMHPYTRCKRLVVKISGMVANFGMACLFLDLETCQKKGDTTLVVDKVECQEHQDDIVQFTSITVAVIVACLLFAAYWFYTCRCARPGGPLHFGKVSESFWVCCTKPITVSIVLLCWCLLIAGLIAHGESSVDFKDSYIPRVWVMSEVYSFFMGFGMQVSIFFSLYCACECCPCLECLFRECWGSGQASGARPSFAYPYGDEYPKDMDAFWRGDRSCGTYGYQSEPLTRPSEPTAA